MIADKPDDAVRNQLQFVPALVNEYELSPVSRATGVGQPRLS